MVAVQFCWFLQVQADVFIAGRILTPHDLGIYTTALFLTQIMATKFVPPLNDVAFAAYSRIQTDRGAIAAAFLKAVRLIMLVALPFYFGLAATAEPVVLTVLGAKWVETVPLVQLLALAMSFLTLQILFGPVTNAIGRPAIAVRSAAAGAVLLPAAFLAGIQFGTDGMALAWLAALPIFTILTAALSLPAIGVGPKALLGSIAPGLAASAAMTLPVLAIDAALPPLPPAVRLAILVLAGAVTYAGLLLLFARSLVREILSFTRTGAAPAGV